MKLTICIVLLLLISLNSCVSSKAISDQDTTEKTITEISSITNKAPYDPRPGMAKLRKENERRKSKRRRSKRRRSNGKVELNKPMHFLVFGDSKGSDRLPDVLKRADLLMPQFCLTTADLVNKGAGAPGEELYKDLDEDAGWCRTRCGSAGETRRTRIFLAGRRLDHGQCGSSRTLWNTVHETQGRY